MMGLHVASSDDNLLAGRLVAVSSSGQPSRLRHHLVPERSLEGSARFRAPRVWLENIGAPLDEDLDAQTS